MKKIFLFFILTVLSFSSCKDFLNMPPKNLKVVYKMEDVKQAMSGYLYGILNTQRNISTNNAISFNGTIVIHPYNHYAVAIGSMLSDDMDMMGFSDESGSTNYKRGGYSYRTDYLEVRKWDSYIFSEKLWNSVFQNIGYLNSVLRDLSKVPDYNKADGERITGEAKIIRTYYLLKLNQLYAPYDLNDYGIPYNLSADVYKGGKRHKQTELYADLIGELTEVLSYETEPRPSWNIFYSKRIIYAILAQTYLYKSGSCAKEATDLENAKKYANLARDNQPIESSVDEQNTLAVGVDTQIKESPSQFCLLRFNNPPDLNPSGGNSYAPWGNPYATPFVVQKPTKELYDLYDQNDIRRSSYFTERNGVAYIMKNAPANGAIDDYGQHNCLFRYSEMMLIEAEAMARLGEGGALTLLNEFRRSKIPGYTGYTGSDVLGEILKERRKEFCFEQQMRWLDMKRLGVTYTRMTENYETKEQEEYTIAKDDYRYTLPIPESEIGYNENNIPQNPGWAR